jgi:hypothetical protein
MLLQRGTNKVEIKKYKDKIGRKLISDNKLLVKEFSFWCDIYNEYIDKLPLFYNYAKSYKSIFNELKKILHDIKQKVLKGYDEETFMSQLAVFVYKYTDNIGYKEISK